MTKPIQENYYIVMERKIKIKFLFIRIIKYERPVCGYKDIEYAEGKIYELGNILNNDKYELYIEKISITNHNTKPL